MNPGISPAILLSLMLLAEAMISRFVTGSALHLTLVLGAGAAQGVTLWFGKPISQVAAAVFAFGVGVGGWHLFVSGLVPISLSEIPGLFHLALATHFLIWALLLTQPGQKGRTLAPTLAPAMTIAGILAGLVIAWTAGTTEIYGTSELLVRSLGFTVLAGAVWLGFHSPKPGRTHAVACASNSPAGKWKSGVAFLAGVGVFVIGAAWLVTPAHRLAGELYTWYGIGGDTTQLDEFGDSDRTFRSGPGPSDGAGRELPRKADIKLDPRPRFYLEIEDAESFHLLTRQPIYLRTSTLSVFENDGKLAPLRSGQWRYDSDDGVVDGEVSLTGGLADSTNAATYSVLIERRDSRAVPLIARTQSVAIESIYAFADDWYQLALEDHQERVRFRATSAQRSVDDLLQTGQTLTGGSAPRAYFQLPASRVAGEVRTIAGGLLQESGRDLNRLLPRLRAWLKGQCAYSLNYENPDDLSAIENFLLGERKGHCELFAASTVMLLRSLGIPSRIAYGFCGGDHDSERNLIAFRESDFHSWAEIYLAGHGWVIFETTPTGDGAVRAPRAGTGGGIPFASLDIAAFEDLGVLGPFEPETPSLFSRMIRLVTDFAADWFFAICAGVVGLGLLGSWIRRRLNRIGLASGAGGTLSTGAGAERDRQPAFLTDYLSACSALGCPKRPGQTLKELLANLRNAGLCNGEFDQLTRYTYAICYAERDRDPELEKQFCQSIQEFETAGRDRDSGS